MEKRDQTVHMWLYTNDVFVRYLGQTITEIESPDGHHLEGKWRNMNVGFDSDNNLWGLI